jgi:ACS family tartrate transporter-like MFS transporter
MYGLVYFVPKMIRGVSGGSNFKIGVLSMLPYAVSAIVMVLVGRHSDRANERNWHLAAVAFAGALGAVATAYSNSASSTVASLSLAMAGCFATLGPFWALSASVLSAPTAATGIAIINSLGNLGGFLGPTSVGLLRNVRGNNRSGMIVVAAASLLAGALALPVRTRRADLPK